MKNLFKFIVASVLALLARAVVLRYHPRIVMVTGSVGKTSTKDAVASVLASRFLVRNGYSMIPSAVFSYAIETKGLCAFCRGCSGDDKEKNNKKDILRDAQYNQASTHHSPFS